VELDVALRDLGTRRGCLPLHNIFVNIAMSWSIVYYRVALQRELLCLPATIQARYVHLTARMTAFGPDLGMPHSRAMGGGLFELRLKAAAGIARVFYCTLPGRRIVMLHQFVKKSEKTPAREIALARRRLKEIRDAHA
jgi:phage-related protein